jgi:predicted DNA-binding transcriptional regulator AlpA
MLRLLTQRDAATLLCLSQRTLERLRVTGAGPRYVKAGRSVRYREADLEAWIAARVVDSTSVPVVALERKLDRASEPVA